MLLGGKQNFLGLFITAIRSDRCSVAAFYPAVTWPPLFPNELRVIPNPVSMVDSGVASHLGPWLPGVMILLLPGCDSVMECSSRVCVCVLSSVCVFIPCVGVHLLCVCSSLLCVHALCVHFLCVCVFIPCVCSSPVWVFTSCVFISCVCIHSLCVHPLCVCSSSVCVFTPYMCVHLLCLCYPLCVFISCVCSHTHLGFASDPSKISLLALGIYLSSLNLDFCSRKPG